MPVIKSASKKLRADRNKEKKNNELRRAFEKALKAAKKNPTSPNIAKAIKLTDKLAKKNLVHKNKAARIKSSLSKLNRKEKKEPSKKAPKAK